MHSEEWIVIPERPMYAVSNHGRVQNLKTGRYLKTSPDGDGYQSVSLYDYGKPLYVLVHILVAQLFIGPPVNRSDDVNHKNGIKSDNRPDNLEWTTHSNNVKHAYRTGLHGIHPRAKKVRVVETGEEFVTIRRCAEELGLQQTSIVQCLLGRQKTHRGYHFEEV